MELMSSGILRVEQWMSSNRLRLNTGKTKVMWVGSKQQLSKIDDERMKIGNSNIAFTTTAKLLGINLDQELSFKQHAKYFTKRLSLHSFRHSSPPVWNSLPLATRLINSDEPSSLPQFYKALKTHLF